jgi:hypothetical protein
MCHKYRFLGRIDENGKRSNHNVNEDIFLGSIHRNVPCRDCHTSIKKIPHDPVKEEVNCANECYIDPPLSGNLMGNFCHGICESSIVVSGAGGNALAFQSYLCAGSGKANARRRGHYGPDSGGFLALDQCSSGAGQISSPMDGTALWRESRKAHFSGQAREHTNKSALKTASNRKNNFLIRVTRQFHM